MADHEPREEAMDHTASTRPIKRIVHNRARSDFNGECLNFCVHITLSRL